MLACPGRSADRYITVRFTPGHHYVCTGEGFDHSSSGRSSKCAQPRDKLATLLWGSTSDEQARGNLRHTLFTIRKAVGAASPLVTEGQTVELAPDAVEVDARAFELRVREGTAEALERAAALYRGELLDGLGIDEPPFEDTSQEARPGSQPLEPREKGSC